MTKDHAYIKAHYGKDKTKDIALALGRTPQYVRCAAKRLGLRKQFRKVIIKPCETCLLLAPNGHCIYGNEGDASRCRAMRYTRGEWPKKTTHIQELFELI